MSNFKFVFFLLCSSQFKLWFCGKQKIQKGKEGKLRKIVIFFLPPTTPFL